MKSIFYKSQQQTAAVTCDGNNGGSQSRTINDLQQRLDLGVTEIIFCNPKPSKETLRQKTETLINGLEQIAGKFSNLQSLEISGYDLSLDQSAQDPLNKLINFVNRSPKLTKLTLKNNNLGMVEIAVIENFIFGEGRNHPLSGVNKSNPISITELDISGSKIDKNIYPTLLRLKEDNSNLRILIDSDNNLEVEKKLEEEQSGSQIDENIYPDPQGLKEDNSNLKILIDSDNNPEVGEKLEEEQYKASSLQLPPRPKTRKEVLMKRIDEALDGKDVKEMGLSPEELLMKLIRLLIQKLVNTNQV